MEERSGDGWGEGRRERKGGGIPVSKGEDKKTRSLELFLSSFHGPTVAINEMGGGSWREPHSP